MSEETNKQAMPQCVGIIMDGNRRWAKARGLSPWEGHTAGYKKLKELVGWGKEYGVKNVVVYAFSTENWKRSAEEVEHILTLFKYVLEHEIDELAKDGVRIRFAGDRSRFPEDMQKLMADVEVRTANLGEYTIMVAASYGGRAELLSAILKLRAENIEATEESVNAALWTAGFPDPDLILRTGGEMRLSNFLLWQSAYSELFFLDTPWPDLSKEEFKGVLETYASRKRNFGA